MAAGEVVGDLVALDGELHLDRNHALAERGVAIDVVDVLPGAVGKLGDALAGGELDVVLHLLAAGDDGVLAVLLDQPEDFALGDTGGLGLRVHVADDRFGIARVGGDHLGEVVAPLAGIDQPRRRDADALAEHLLGEHVEGARRRAADIGPVAVGLGEGDDLVAHEHRADDAHVVEMGAAGVGIVGHEHVARPHVVLEGVDNRLAGVVQRADVDRDVHVALGDGIAVGVVQGGGEVAVVDDEGIAGPEDLLRHLVDGRDEGVLQDLEGDRIKRDASAVRAHLHASATWIRMLSHSSTSARTPGGMTVVESSCSTIAGPSMATPAGSPS